MSRRLKTISERRQELIDSLTIVKNAIEDLEKHGGIYNLRIVADQLRALIVKESQSRSLSHPLLIDIAGEMGYPLTLYMWDPSYKNKIMKLNPANYFGGDSLSADRDEKYTYQISLEEALETHYITIGDTNLSLKNVVRDIADTEGSHYDTDRPEHMDQLDNFQIGGLPTEYRAIYSLARLIIVIGSRFIQFTA